MSPVAAGVSAPSYGYATPLPPRRVARDAGVVTDPAASAPRGDEAMPRNFRRLRRSPGAPRAVFEACSTRTPEDLPNYPPLAGPLTGISVVGTTQAPDPEAPVTRGDARRTRAAWTAGGRLAKGIGRPPLPVRTSVRVATRPCFGPRHGDNTRAWEYVDKEN